MEIIPVCLFLQLFLFSSSILAQKFDTESLVKWQNFVSSLKNENNYLKFSGLSLSAEEANISGIQIW